MMICEKIGLTESEYNALIEIISSFPEVKEAIVYGSRAKGNFKPYSDVDLALKSEHPAQEVIFRMSDRLEESTLPYLFDISDYNAINNPDLREHIDRCGLRIYPGKP